jgi:beta-lactamase regulating signal transducer with metallopeptidase domain
VLIKLVAPPLLHWPRPTWTPWQELRVPVVRYTLNVVADHPQPGPLVAVGPKIKATAPQITNGPLSDPRLRPLLESASWSVIGLWIVGTASLGVWQLERVLRFRRGLCAGSPAPDWLVGEAERIATQLGVRVPDLLTVPTSTTPMLWFLGRPKLLLPAQLVDTLGVPGWKGILAHELAHVRRRDHWIRRIELLAGLLWWWNPLYWLTRRRLAAESELACDAWVVRIFPQGRVAYAEALLHVCRLLSPAKPPLAALGAGSAGSFLERRVTLILRNQVSFPASAPVLIGAGILALLALPCWSASTSPADDRCTGDAACVTDDNKSDLTPADAVRGDDRTPLHSDDPRGAQHADARPAADPDPSGHRSNRTTQQSADAAESDWRPRKDAPDRRDDDAECIDRDDSSGDDWTDSNRRRTTPSLTAANSTAESRASAPLRSPPVALRMRTQARTPRRKRLTPTPDVQGDSAVIRDSVRDVSADRRHPAAANARRYDNKPGAEDSERRPHRTSDRVQIDPQERAQRIKQLRALIDLLDQQLKSLEAEAGGDESKRSAK